MFSLLVLRIEEPLGFKIARIIDFISKDEAEIFTLQNAINFCRENGCHLIDFFFSGNFHIDSLEKVGFKEANQEPYFSIPLLFNPIDRERKYINLAFKVINPKIKNEKAADINNWYVTKGDGDQDRPNIL